MNFIKKIKLLLVATCSLIVLFTACKKTELSQNQPSSPAIEKLALSKENWNKNAASVMTLKSFETIQVIKNESERKSIVAEIFNLENQDLIAVGNVLDVTTLKVNTANELSNSEVSTIENNFSNYENEIKVGDNVVAIHWNKNGKDYTTKCVTRGEDIIWDNVLTNVVMIDSTKSTEFPKADSMKSLATNYSSWYKKWWTADWIWGSQRGEIGYKITIYYSTSNYLVTNTDHEDWGNMSLGSAKSESKITKNSGSYGKIQYALGLCTPAGSLSFNSTNFSVSFSGVGSNIVQNGTKSLYP